MILDTAHVLNEALYNPYYSCDEGGFYSSGYVSNAPQNGAKTRKEEKPAVAPVEPER